MRCEQLRTALSARLDGEPAGVPDRRLDKHVARCAVCRDWLERAERLRGPLLADRTGGDPSGEWTAALLARLGAEPAADSVADEVEGRPGQGDGGRTR
ncbi:zf-HC2 domain-containing protein [Streptomyces sp. NRRL S-495]|uniref:zf-HC2 domain-containing protein n=1 Tax=Streptomyces sp. NRRL S-495 TaxID=1609133 RepID=UPI000695B940|nr:zf-HC2 domain-containing protein [Streptomyces sp. NRRL S-495]